MNKFLTLTALAAALTFAGTTTAEARSPYRGAHNVRVAHQYNQLQQSSYALSGQTTLKADKAYRGYNRYAHVIKGGRNTTAR